METPIRFTCVWRAAIVGLLLFATAPDAKAQFLTRDARVRIIHDGGPRSEGVTRSAGTLLRLGADTLWYRPDGRETSAAVPLASVVRIETRERASRGHGAWKWAKRAFLAGAAVGAATCLIDPDPCKSRPDEGAFGAASGSAVWLGTGGAMFGALGGALFPGRRWRGVSPPYTMTTDTTLAAGPAPQGRRPQHGGFWIGFGAGPAYSWIDCRACGPPVTNDPWDGGLGASLFIALGGTVRPNLLVGGELSLWSSTHSAEEVAERNATVLSLDAVAQYYPTADRRLYLKGGIGIGGAILETSAEGTRAVEDVESEGWSLQGGVGYDIPLGRRLALSPHLTYVQTISRGAETTIGGEPVVGPDSPSYLVVGAALIWY